MVAFLLTLAFAIWPGRAAHAQAWTGAVPVGDSTAANGTAAGTRVRPDGQGGFWLLGTFQGKIRCGTTTLRSRANSSDIYLGRLDAAGQWLWAQAIGGPLLDRGGDLVVDAAGNAVLTGSFQDSLRLGAFPLVAQGAARTNAFVAAISPAGQWRWVAQAGGDALGTALALDPVTGAAVVAGAFGGVVTFGPATLAATTNLGTDRDVFLARLSTTGQWLSASRAGGNRIDLPTALALDGTGHAILVGTTTSRTMAFGGLSIRNRSETNYTQQSLPLYADMFVAQYDLTALQWRWAKAGGGGSNETADAVAIGPAGRITVAGTYNGRGGQTDTVTRFGTIVLTPRAPWAQPVYVARLSATGQWLAAISAADSSFVEVGGLTLDAADEATVSGHFVTRAVFGSIRLTASACPPGITLAPFDPSDLFVAHLNSANQWTWALAAGGPGTNTGASHCTDPATGALTLTGRFTGAPRFTAVPLTPAGGGVGAAFVAQLTVSGATRQWAWATATDGGGAVRVLQTALDGQGNTLVVGTFTGQQRLGAFPLTPPTAVDALNGRTLFVAKRSPAGQWLWATAAQAHDPYDRSPRLVVEPSSGDAYVAGTLTGAAIFGPNAPGAVPPLLPSLYGPRRSLYVARISAAGQWLWATTPAYSSGSEVNGLALDPRGGVALVGSFNDTLRLGATTLLVPNLNPMYPTSSIGMLIRVSAFGQWRSAVQVGEGRPNYLTAVELDARGGATVVGSFIGREMRFDSLITVTQPRFGFWTAVARLDAANRWRWVVPTQIIRQGSGCEMLALANDRAGHLLVSGSTTDSVGFGPLVLRSRTAVGEYADGFVAQIDTTTRQWTWVRPLEAPSYYGHLSALAVDAVGDAYVGGIFAGTARLGASIVAADRPNGAPIVAKISPAGVWRWAAAARAGSALASAAVISLEVLAPNELLVAGNFSGAPLAFGATTLTGSRTETGFLASIGAPLGLTPDDVPAVETLQLYPNPARTTVTLRLPVPARDAVVGQLFDALGRVVRRFTIPAGQTEVALDLTSRAPGLYLVRAAGQTRRLVVE